MPKKIFTILIIIFLSGCGYQSIYENRNQQNISIDKIILSGDASINRRILNLAGLKQDDESGPHSYNLKLTNTKLIKVTAKDSLGNASIFKMTININFSLIHNNKKKKQRVFTSSFVYNNSKDKFELTQYEKTLENNLINELVEEIIIFINL